MFPLVTKHSGGKLLHHSDLRGGVFLGETPRGYKDYKYGGNYHLWTNEEVNEHSML
jgi:hypothetical protein